MPLQATSGAASYDGFGGGVPFTPTYIEDVFSTWLYTGNGSTQTITNGIDLSTKGGLVWIKARSGSSGFAHRLIDTARGASNFLESSSTDAQSTNSFLSAFNANGFSLNGAGAVNFNTNPYASWTFRKQPKFFDVVTYTGNGNPQNISHNLGSTPGLIIVKGVSGDFSTGNWAVYHRSLTATTAILLNSANAAFTTSSFWNNTEPTSTQFTVGTAAQTGAPNTTYVAYLFAHDAGGFGLTGTDNVISCGAFTNSGSSTATVNLGYEPQWLLVKSTVTAQNWFIFDTMRGMPWSSGANYLNPNTSSAETGAGPTFSLTATGFSLQGFIASEPYIYIAIRRGPMKTPTSGTSVFNPVARTGTGTNPTVVTTNNNPDLLMSFPRTASPAAYGMCFWDKLRGISPMLQSATTSAETNTNTTRVLQGWLNTGYQAGADFIEGYLNYSGSDYVNYPITRAPGFFDVVCYTGTGANRTVTHNLGVAPELMIVKNRSSAGYGWLTYSATLGATKYLQINSTAAEGTVSTYWNNTAPTSSVFSVGTAGATNASGDTFVAYLFASCPGVSKVGSYTGTGATLQIDCGFTGGARFVLIKRTDASGDWYVWDSARGIVSGNDPYLLLNSTAAEVTNTDYVDTYSAGFEISSTAPAAINANGGTYIFLAIA